MIDAIKDFGGGTTKSAILNIPKVKGELAVQIRGDCERMREVLRVSFSVQLKVLTGYLFSRYRSTQTRIIEHTQ